MPYFGNQVDTIFDSVGSASDPAVINASSINNGQIGGRRNLIYNGAMQLAQRGTTITGVTTSTYQCDRWFYNSEAEETVTLEQSSDAPDGFGYSQKITVTTADADLTDDYVEIEQTFEGLDLQQLTWGTSSAKPLTVSLWVKSSQTGSCAIGLYMAGTATMIGSTFTINSANTWEYKTVTFAGNTTDAITNDNAQRLRLWIGLAAGSAYNGTDNTSWSAYTNAKRLYGQTLNLVGTTSATFQMTGVQMEVGSVATKFEHTSYGEELALCQRYYHRITNPSALYGRISAGRVFSATLGSFTYHFPVPMRASATLETTGTASDYAIGYSGTTALCTALPYVYAYTNTGGGPITASIIGTSTGMTVGQGAEFLFRNIANLYLGFDAEL
jgi:hypothetical protein